MQEAGGDGEGQRQAEHANSSGREGIGCRGERLRPSSINVGICQRAETNARCGSRGAPAPAGQHWVGERTTRWTNAHKKLVWGTKRQVTVVAFRLAFSAAIIVVGRLEREGWISYSWDGRPIRKP